ncbi:hypothetical protein BDV26DRAFT_275273 [Aspergillus bertholletiae]|uniref:Heterokaryon incompatibility domain-containing protein n=1 Tax=Aspergillus bertholletiae TaxID=1226010 RepID=A0A5N7APT2_9EURO|nr:hypothetical protein BDV26DRAFT_275273 [Aspergillus bertholletiae]
MRILIFMNLRRGGEDVSAWRAFSALSNSAPVTNLGIRERRLGLPLPEATQATQKWIESCVGPHERCQKNVQPRVYPTRLLKVGKDKIRLVLSATNKLSGSYATLSYCWGPKETHNWPRLSDTNFSTFERGISIANLPIAFQEAIQFLKSLSIHNHLISYLWIDSFCTIQEGQGSAED